MVRKIRPAIYSFLVIFTITSLFHAWAARSWASKCQTPTQEFLRLPVLGPPDAPYVLIPDEFRTRYESARVLDDHLTPLDPRLTF